MRIRSTTVWATIPTGRALWWDTATSLRRIPTTGRHTASWKNALDTPETNRHILYGALVGGPNEDGSYEDDRQNYINNEVACDYNAGFTALLCKMTDAYGGTPDRTFPNRRPGTENSMWRPS